MQNKTIFYLFMKAQYQNLCVCEDCRKYPSINYESYREKHALSKEQIERLARVVLTNQK